MLCSQTGIFTHVIVMDCDGTKVETYLCFSSAWDGSSTQKIIPVAKDHQPAM